MKKSIRILILFVLLGVFLWPQAAFAQGPEENKFVLGGVYTLESGEILNGSLIVLGGVATLEENSLVNGNVLVAGGAVEVNGRVEGDIFATGGLITLGDSANVTGNVTTLGAEIDQSSQAVVEGSVNTGDPGSIQLPNVGGINIPNLPNLFFWSNPLFSLMWGILWLVLKSFVWAGLAIFAVLLFPNATKRVSHTAVSQPILAGGVGLLTVIVFPVLMGLLLLTIILIPVSLLGIAALAVVWIFGVIALGTEIGERLAEMFKVDWALALSAGIGTFFLTLIVFSVDKIVPCVGWVPQVLVAMLGVGAVLLTRFGSQAYPPPQPAQEAASPAPLPAETPSPALEEGESTNQAPPEA